MASYAQGAPPTPAANPTSEAKALAKSMRLIESARIGFEVLVQKRIQGGLAGQKELDCVRADDLAFAADAYASAIDASLSPEEIKDAVGFFSTPEGQAYLDYSRTLEMQQRGIPNPHPKGELTAAETRETLKFMERSARKKILDERVLESTELKWSLLNGVTGLVDAAKPGARRLQLDIRTGNSRQWAPRSCSPS
jgi:hypothetical protein